MCFQSFHLHVFLTSLPLPVALTIFLLVDNAPTMLYSYELDENNKNPFSNFVSEGSMAVFAITPEEVMADVQTLWSTIHPDDLSTCLEDYKMSFETLTNWEVTARHLVAGEYRVITSRSTPVRLPDGRTR